MPAHLHLKNGAVAASTFLLSLQVKTLQQLGFYIFDLYIRNPVFLVSFTAVQFLLGKTLISPRFLLSQFPYTQCLTCRQMKPFKYLLILSSVLIRPCNSCHAPHVSLKHNVINTSSALMDASHMNALMKCVIVFPHRTLTISLMLSP